MIAKRKGVTVMWGRRRRGDSTSAPAARFYDWPLDIRRHHSAGGERALECDRKRLERFFRERSSAWSASAPNSFTVYTAKDFSTDLTAASDATMLAIRSGGTTEVRGADLAPAALGTSAELETIPNRVAVPGTALQSTRRVAL